MSRKAMSTQAKTSQSQLWFPVGSELPTAFQLENLQNLSCSVLPLPHVKHEDDDGPPPTWHCHEDLMSPDEVLRIGPGTESDLNKRW